MRVMGCERVKERAIEKRVREVVMRTRGIINTTNDELEVNQDNRQRVRGSG
jgi:hypothetical protein